MVFEQQAAAIFSVPAEVIESILIISAAADRPQSIASLSRTCKYFNELVYKSSDRHLWREIYLSTFDDPRPSLDFCRKLYGDHHSFLPVIFDWAGQYQEKVKARALLRRSTEVLPMMGSKSASGTSLPTTSWSPGALVSPRLMSVIKSFISIIETSSPFPSTPIMTFSRMHSGFGYVSPPRHRFITTPPFPPLMILLSSPITDRSFGSQSVPWLEKVLQNGYPPELTRLLFAQLRVDACAEGITYFDNVDPSTRPRLTPAWRWQDSELAMLFHKLVCWAGFIPIGIHEQKEQENEDRAASEQRRRPFIKTMSGATGVGHADGLDAPALPSSEEQFADVRCLARRRVYDMRYLRKERAWGPFLPIIRQSTVIPPPFSPTRSSMYHPANLPLLTVLHHQSLESNEGPSHYHSSELEDGVQSSAMLDSEENAAQHDQEDREEGSESTDAVSEEGSEDEISPVIINLVVGHGIGRSHNGILTPPIAPAELRPDWVWLASARIVVEANLKEMLRRRLLSDDEGGTHDGEWNISEIITALRRLEGLRAGGVPGYWQAWESGKAWRADTFEASDVKGKAKAADQTTDPSTRNGGVNMDVDDEVVEGWDWAGCEGVWKRCVCWLDYRDLLIHNFNRSRFYDPELQEALRIVPMTLRITGYSKPSSPPVGSSSWMGGTAYRNGRDLPVIHIEGHMAGPETSPEEIRTVKGTVSMIAEGAIRWSFVSTLAGANEPEWQTEAVQIGNPGSACGLVGMWTGALHEPSDPLGAVWAWKVA